MTTRPHIPVLLNEVLEHLSPADDEIYIDGTFGAGGYSTAILEQATCRVVGFDRDPVALAHAKTTEARFAGRFRLVGEKFSTMADHVATPVNGVVLDIGVSSMQIDEGSRGFSFLKEGPLDMRMSAEGATAADLVNTLSLDALASIFRVFGEEKFAKPIARSIVERRVRKPFETTRDLADLIDGQTPPHKRFGIHPATRVFQALRIAVNDELEELARGLEAAEAILAEGGRLVVVSFHSLEDRIVKSFLRDASETGTGSRHVPLANAIEPRFKIQSRKAVTAGDKEVALNSRSRSAKLRSAVRTAATARPLNPAILRQTRVQSR